MLKMWLPFKKLCTKLLFGWVEGFQKLKTADLFQESTYDFNCYFDQLPNHEKKEDGGWQLPIKTELEKLWRDIYVQTLGEAEEHTACSQ